MRCRWLLPSRRRCVACCCCVGVFFARPRVIGQRGLTSCVLLLQTAPKIFGGPIKTHLLVFTDAKGADGELDGVKEVAKEIKGKLLAVTVASSNDRVLNYFGIEKSA
jgi:hypothetical protein